MAPDHDLAVLRDDYLGLAAAGIKRADTADDTASVPLARLTAAGLARVHDGVVILERPEDVPGLGPATEELGLLRAAYALWLRSGDAGELDEILYGEAGFWQHWWNAMHRDDGPRAVRMDVCLPDDGHFSQRDWLAEFDRALIEYALGNGLVLGRVLVPPDTFAGPARGLVALAVAHGLEARVFRSTARFVIYDGETAVLPEGSDELEGVRAVERHRSTTRPSVVGALATLFELQWQAAIPWDDYREDLAGVLHLLSLGWTDQRIATALGVSPRTVHRRVAEAMARAGVRTRFELGMAYARSEHRRAAGAAGVADRGNPGAGENSPNRR